MPVGFRTVVAVHSRLQVGVLVYEISELALVVFDFYELQLSKTQLQTLDFEFQLMVLTLSFAETSLKLHVGGF